VDSTAASLTFAWVSMPRWLWGVLITEFHLAIRNR